jgi:hypothetical protein
MTLEAGQVYTSSFMSFYEVLSVNSRDVRYRFFTSKASGINTVSIEEFLLGTHGYKILTELTKALL